MRAMMAAVLAAAAIAGLAQAKTDPTRKTPYWASIAPGLARMRTGPGRNYPASWLYQRQGLPVQVLEAYPGWRKVKDPEGTSGWMISQLVSEHRTGMIKDGIAELREAPNISAKVLWRAEPGVIGQLSRCAEGWCRLDVQGKAGFVETSRLWGVDPGETLG